MVIQVYGIWDFILFYFLNLNKIYISLKKIFVS